MNPAVTLGIFLDNQVKNTGAFDVDSLLGYWAGEFIGAMIGATLVFLHYRPHWSETADPGLKLAVFSTGPAIRNMTWNLISEIIGTFVLIFVGFSFGNNADRRRFASIGGALGACWSSRSASPLEARRGTRSTRPATLGRGSCTTSCRSRQGQQRLGVRVIPVVGPLIGGALAATFY